MLIPFLSSAGFLNPVLRRQNGVFSVKACSLQSIRGEVTKRTALPAHHAQVVMPDAVPFDPLFIRLSTGFAIGATIVLAGRFVHRILQVLLSLAALMMIYVLLANGPEALIEFVEGLVIEILWHPAVLLGVIVGAAAFHDAGEEGGIQ